MARGYYIGDDGLLHYEQSGISKFFNGTDTDSQLNTISYNEDIRRYEEQADMQRQELSANLDNMKFNQDLQSKTFDANLQNQEWNQKMSEESYYNGVLNEASQLQKLGINPATQSLAGTSASMVSGISSGSTSGVPQGSAPGKNSSWFNGNSQNALQLLATLLSSQNAHESNEVAKKQADVAKQNADTNQYNAETTRMRAESQNRVDDDTLVNNNVLRELNWSQIGLNKSNTSYVDSKTADQILSNADKELSNSQLHALGISRETIRSWQNFSTPALASLGILTLLGNVTDTMQHINENQTAEVKQVADSVVKTAQEYSNLEAPQKSAYDDFFNDNPQYAYVAKDYINDSTLAEWRRNNYDYDQVYNRLKKLFGVK